MFWSPLGCDLVKRWKLRVFGWLEIFQNFGQTFAGGVVRFDRDLDLLLLEYYSIALWAILNMDNIYIPTAIQFTLVR